MKYNQYLKAEVEKYIEYVAIVEGKKDASALISLGFQKVYTIHSTGIPLRERVEYIASHIDKKDKVCILTDLDKRGKKLYMTIKPIFQELGVKLDSSLRGLLIKAGVSHIEGLSSFMQKIENI